MATNTAGSNARQNSLQMTHYLRFRVNFNDGGIAGGVKKQTLPAGAIITGTSVYVGQVFNAVTTNVLTVGVTQNNANEIVATGDVDESAVALTNAIKPTGAALGPLAADTPVYAKYTQTGTAATTGWAIVMIHYIPNNDM